MLRPLLPLISALALVATPLVAHAEEPTKSYPDCGREPTEAEVAAAKGAFQAGNASFNEADYARAIDYWEDAYRRDCTANPLLLNLARAYELAGRKRQAVVALETFLTREPNSGEKDQINRRIEVLKKKIAEEDAAAAAPPPPVTPPTTTPPPVVAPPNQPAEAQAKHSPGPWILIGLGAVGATIGTIGVVDNNKKISEANRDCGDKRVNCPAEVAQKGNDARSGLTRSTVLLVGGGAVLAGGVVWWFIDNARVERENAHPQAKLQRPRIVPIFSPEVAGLSVSGAF
jgi:tetratricopeptide (TPR) repeat protein